MELEVQRVLRNEVAEHSEIHRTVFILVGSVVKIEQSNYNSERTNLMFSWGEEITIDEDIHKFKKRVDTFIEEENEKIRAEERRGDLGLG